MKIIICLFYFYMFIIQTFIATHVSVLLYISTVGKQHSRFLCYAVQLVNCFFFLGEEGRRFIFCNVYVVVFKECNCRRSLAVENDTEYLHHIKWEFIIVGAYIRPLPASRKQYARVSVWCIVIHQLSTTMDWYTACFKALVFPITGV